jgi:hypothetical protein
MRLLKVFVLLATVTATVAATALADPGRNVQAQLRPAAGGPEGAFGLVEFRQPKDENKIVLLGVWVRDLLPNHSYRLQRATDMTGDDLCTGTNWLTLGKGLVPEAIATDDRGTGRAELFRDLATVPTGTQFDIHFRVIDAITSAVVLESACYQFINSQ